MLVALYAFSLLAGALFLHPYISYPLSLRLMRARPVRGCNADAPRPSASLLFSAYNEERALPTKLDNLEAIKKLHPDLEILGYSDMSTDGTLALLESRPELLRVIPTTERTGKATGMRHMVAQARGEICIFTDANVLLAPESVGVLLDYFRDPAIGAVSGTLHYINAEEGATAQVGGLYWRLEETIKALESRCGSMMGADGAIFATRRALYPEVPPHLLDDMIASMSVLLHGKRLISAREVIAYERTTTDPVDEFRRKRRIACRSYASYLHLWPQLAKQFSLTDRYKFISHKWLRWMGAPLALLAAGSLSAALWLDRRPDLLIALWGAPALVLLGAALKVRPCVMVVEIAAAIWASFLGVIDAWRGRTYQTWAPAKSRD
ncbi:glycosyltransferase [Sphingobium sp. DEHP117]|uniref:glycosyltransferase n=1 Tax=Sphingobium sp. DEHP117 TaxID=2993436 RepID=UPI0027D56E5F|nr:glycosyltransferase [Sphingobium sp. DEHP117]MDQ4420529.1 glycosyltransferase [Sphingobium sp. DEHP117]